MEHVEWRAQLSLPLHNRRTLVERAARFSSVAVRVPVGRENRFQSRMSVS